jgi:hypothetical protein
MFGFIIATVLQAAAPPAAPDLASSLVTVASSDRPIRVTIAGQVEEDYVRYQLLLSRHVSLAATQTPGTPPAYACQWKIEAVMQRSICNYSRSGIFLCSDPSLRQLPDNASGSIAIGPADNIAEQCSYSAPPVAAATKELADRLKREATELINGDVRTTSQGLTKAGRQ